MRVDFTKPGDGSGFVARMRAIIVRVLPLGNV
jgi:hypothetical protein